jgi:hypothetical protein
MLANIQDMPLRRQLLIALAWRARRLVFSFC